MRRFWNARKYGHFTPGTAAPDDNPNPGPRVDRVDKAGKREGGKARAEHDVSELGSVRSGASVCVRVCDSG